MPCIHDSDTDLRHPGLYIGVVVSNQDPLKLGRVRVRIPGLIEPASEWALPLGTIGGGSMKRGGFFVPDEGADVGVLFREGDTDVPFYVAGQWGETAAGTETPTPLAEASVADAPKIGALETARYLIVMDNRSGAEKLYLRDKVTGDMIALSDTSGITVQTVKNVDVQAGGNVTVNGATVVMNGGVAGVSRLGDPIQGTIPIGTVFVPDPVTGSPIPNPIPIPITGTIVGASSTVKAG